MNRLALVVTLAALTGCRTGDVLRPTTAGADQVRQDLEAERDRSVALQRELEATQAELATRQDELAAAQSDLGARQADLDRMQADLDACRARLR